MKKYFPYLLIVMAIVAIGMFLNSCNPKIIPVVTPKTKTVHWEATNENLVRQYVLQFSSPGAGWVAIDSVKPSGGVYALKIPYVPGFLRLKLVESDSVRYSSVLNVR